MSLYLIIFVILFFIGALSVYIRVNKSISFIILTVLVVFGSVRYNIGMDYENYSTIFDSFGNKPLSYQDSLKFYIEPGYAIIISYLKYFGFTNDLLFAAHILLSLYFVNNGIKKYSPNHYISWIILYGAYYVNLFFNGIRQGLFIAILLSYLPDLVQSKRNSTYKVILLTVLLAFFLHKTALILPLIYLLSRIRPSLMTKYVVLMISIFWAFSGIGSIIVQIGGFSLLKESAYLGVIDFYSNNETFGAEIKFLSISVFHRLAILVVAFYFLKHSKNDVLYDILTNIYFWSVVIYFILVPFGYIIATRVGMNIKVFDLLLLPFIISFVKDKKFSLLVYFIICLGSMGLMLTNFYIPGNYEYYVPYRSILNKK
jgi:hypothetical protein